MNSSILVHKIALYYIIQNLHSAIIILSICLTIFWQPIWLKSDQTLAFIFKIPSQTDSSSV